MDFGVDPSRSTQKSKQLSQQPKSLAQQLEGKKHYLDNLHFELVLRIGFQIREHHVSKMRAVADRARNAP